MLSVEFGDHREWYVSSGAFELLFDTATATGAIPASFLKWRRTAAANGGLSVSDLDDDVARTLTDGFRATAQLMLTDSESGSLDDGYRISFEKLLAVLSGP